MLTCGGLFLDELISRNLESLNLRVLFVRSDYTVVGWKTNDIFLPIQTLYVCIIVGYFIPPLDNKIKARATDI